MHQVLHAEEQKSCIPASAKALLKISEVNYCMGPRKKLRFGFIEVWLFVVTFPIYSMAPRVAGALLYIVLGLLVTASAFLDVINYLALNKEASQSSIASLVSEDPCFLESSGTWRQV
jgi:hypothetical protein